MTEPERGALIRAGDVNLAADNRERVIAETRR